MSDALDLESIDTRPLAEAGVKMELLDLTGAPTGVILRVRGYDSATYTRTLEEQQRRRMEMLPRKPTEVEARAWFYEEQSALVAGWEGKPLRRAGKVLEYSPANAALLLEGYDIILEQVRRFAGSRKHFSPGSASS